MLDELVMDRGEQCKGIASVFLQKGTAPERGAPARSPPGAGVEMPVLVGAFCKRRAGSKP